MSESSWQPVALAPILAGIEAGEIVGPVPSLMARTDGACLLYPGEVHALQGEPESGKGWIALGAVSACLMGGEGGLYLDFEDAPASIMMRLLALDTPAEEIVAHFTYVRPCDPFRPAALTALLDARPYGLAVIDGLSEAYALMGLDGYSNSDAAQFLAALPRPIAERGAAVIEIDHVIKNRETRGRFAIGAQHKLAGIAVAYSTEVIAAPSRANAGVVKVRVEKDRHGHVRANAENGVIALAHITPSDGGERVAVTLEPPDSTGAAGEFRPTTLMGRIAGLVEAEPGASITAIRKAVKGNAEAKDAALRALIAEGYIRREIEGQGKPTRHYSVRAFDTDSPTLPDPAQTLPKQGVGDPAHMPLPLRGAGQGPRANGHGDPAHVDMGRRVREIEQLAKTDEAAAQAAWDRLGEGGT